MSFAASLAAGRTRHSAVHSAHPPPPHPGLPHPHRRSRRGRSQGRLGQQGDTCVDNAGANAPYVVVSSVFDGGAYRVQPASGVMFQHGSLHEVVDQEKEPCGCPPPVAPQGNEFPLAQSEGLAPLPAPIPTAANQNAAHRRCLSRWFTRVPTTRHQPAADALRPQHRCKFARYQASQEQSGFFGASAASSAHLWRGVAGWIAR